ncbi:hypothetical protein OQA88_8179 [Cercophora sp. LCS_1]
METGKPAAPPHVSPKGMWISKLGLRGVMIIFGIALLGLAGSLATSFLSSLPFLVVGPPGFVSLAWNVAEGICIVTRGGHRGIHPGANVALDLLLWLALVCVCVALWFLGLASSAIGSYSYFSSYDDLYNDAYYSAREIAGKGQAMLGICAVLVILHFTTFVIACYETNVRNRKKVFVLANPGVPMQPVYSAYPPAQPQFDQGQAYQQQHLPPQQMYYPPQPYGLVQTPLPVFHPPGIKSSEMYPTPQSTPPPPTYPVTDQTPLKEAP